MNAITLWLRTLSMSGILLAILLSIAPSENAAKMLRYVSGLVLAIMLVSPLSSLLKSGTLPQVQPIKPSSQLAMTTFAIEQIANQTIGLSGTTCRVMMADGSLSTVFLQSGKSPTQAERQNGEKLSQILTKLYGTQTPVKVIWEGSTHG